MVLLMPHYISDFVKRLSKQYFFSPSIINRLAFWFGYPRTRDILSALKRPTSYYPIRVNTLKTTRANLMDLLEKLLNIEVKPHPLLTEAILIPVKGPYKIPNRPKKVVAYKTAAEGVMRGADLYAPGVREADDNIEPNDEVVIVDKYGQKVGVGLAQLDSDQMLEHKKDKIAVKVTKSLYWIPHLRNTAPWNEGLFYQQTIPSMVTVHVLDPQPNEKILDMCAAPGGKTSHIAQLTKNKAKIIAVDHSSRKVKTLKQTLSRLGISRNIRILRADSRKLDMKFREGFFDKVLLDPPCSALGIRPKLFDGTIEKNVVVSATYQRGFLKSAVRLVCSGGRIVYSTCTIDPLENELNIKFITDNFDVEVEEQKVILGDTGLKIVDYYKFLQRFYPDIHDTPGYFIASLRKR